MLKETLETVISTKITYSDIQTQMPKESIFFKIGMENKEAAEEQKLSYEYTLNLAKSFTDNIEIEPISSQNAVILNEENEEYRNKILETLLIKIAEVNKDQMTKLELREDENPLIYATPIGYMMIEMNSTINQAIEGTNKAKQAQKEEEEKANEIMKNLDETVKNSFNAKFTSFQGEQSGGAIKSLLSTVISNNLSNEIVVSVNGMKDQYKITNYMNNIETRKRYNVNLKTNQYGYINEIEIKEIS